MFKQSKSIGHSNQIIYPSWSKHQPKIFRNYQRDFPVQVKESQVFFFKEDASQEGAVYRVFSMTFLQLFTTNKKSPVMPAINQRPFFWTAGIRICSHQDTQRTSGIGTVEGWLVQAEGVHQGSLIQQQGTEHHENRGRLPCGWEHAKRPCGHWSIWIQSEVNIIVGRCLVLSELRVYRNYLTRRTP